MNIRSTTLALTLVWGACYANISHATIITFESMGFVEEVFFPSPDLPMVGDPVADRLILDVGDDGIVRDVVSFSAVGAGTITDITPVGFGLTFVDGVITGFLNSFVTDAPFLTVSDVWDGTGGTARFVVSFDETVLGGTNPPVALYAGTNTFTAVPEPGSLALLGIGVAGIALRRKRQRS